MEQELKTKLSIKTTWIIAVVAVIFVAVSTAFIISKFFGAPEGGGRHNDICHTAKKCQPNSVGRPKRERVYKKRTSV